MCRSHLLLLVSVLIHGNRVVVATNLPAPVGGSTGVSVEGDNSQIDMVHLKNDFLRNDDKDQRVLSRVKVPSKYNWMKPPWWKSYRQTFLKRRLKKCEWLYGVAPSSGSSCPRKNNGDWYMCMFGTQICNATSGSLPGLTGYTGMALGPIHPTTRCTCDLDQNYEQSWTCVDWMPCDPKIPIDTAPKCPLQCPIRQTTIIAAAYETCAPLPSRTLVANFGVYPGYTGVLKPGGDMTVRFNADGAFLLKLNVNGVEVNCTKCGVHIHTGMTCSNASLVGPHFWNFSTFGANSTNDPWNVFGYYMSDGAGMSNTALAGNSGIGFDSNIGRAAVLHAAVRFADCAYNDVRLFVFALFLTLVQSFEWICQNGTRIACGLLQESSSPTVVIGSLEGTMAAYPGGPISPSGRVAVDVWKDNVLKVHVSLRGVYPNCTKCGIHIHTGTSCESASLVGGPHYWNPVTYGTVDPWTVVNGSYYNSDACGNANSYFYLDSGYGLDANDGHTVVVHAQNGTRIGCGTLSRVPGY